MGSSVYSRAPTNNTIVFHVCKPCFAGRELSSRSIEGDDVGHQPWQGSLSAGLYIREGINVNGFAEASAINLTYIARETLSIG